MARDPLGPRVTAPNAPLAVSLWMGAVVASATLALMAAPVLAPSIARDLDLSPEWVGLYSGTVWGSALLISAWAGRIVERLGAWQTSRLCAVLCALGVAAAASAHPLGLLASGHLAMNVRGFGSFVLLQAVFACAAGLLLVRSTGQLRLHATPGGA